MPVPQTLTSGLAALLTMYSANARQTFNAPSPAPSPRTGCPSTYAFWLMSSLALFLDFSEASL